VFSPVIVEKLQEYDIEVLGKTQCSDDPEMITQAIKEWIGKGAQMVICTGGMSVDPDDRTPLAIRNATDTIVTYGAPMLPGAMFLLAYANDVAVMGLPSCVMYAHRTIFDLVLPRVAAGERMQAEDFTVLGEGGLCLSCPTCTYPNCGFGKGR
jgi:molybdopterin biosynthesis enzyme